MATYMLWRKMPKNYDIITIATNPGSRHPFTRTPESINFIAALKKKLTSDEIITQKYDL